MGADARNRNGTPKIRPLRKPRSVTALSALGLFILAVFYTIYLARDFFLPVAMAWILSVLLRPVIRLARRARIPESLSAALVLALVLGLFLGGMALLSAPASEWLQRLPESLAKVEAKFRRMASSAREIQQAAKSVENLANGGESQTATPKVEIQKPRLVSSLWSQTKGALAMVVEVFVLLYFFLAAGDLFMLKLIQVLPKLADKQRAMEIARETERAVSRYLMSMTLINLYEGTAIGFGLALIGMPNPLLWGALAFFANYIPYLGAMAAAAIVTIVAIVSFDSMAHALLAPAIYLGVNFLDNFAGPYILGRRLVLSPLVVFLAVMFWGWLWGIPGVLLSVPLTMTVKIICEHTSAWAPFSEFLSASRAGEVASAPVERDLDRAKGKT